MLQKDNKRVLEKIEQLHYNDKEQLDVIFSKKKRIVVEAPAGYGKTKTMVSRIAYLIAANKVPNPKKILALTFSINAAYKIKKDIIETLPSLFSTLAISPNKLKNKVFATNYHGFCRRILKKYGFLIDNSLKNINYLRNIDDGKQNSLLNIGIDRGVAKEIVNYNIAIKKKDIKFVMDKKRFHSYLEKVKKYLLPKDFIPYNAIILLTIKLFEDYPEILSFYRSYFPIVIVDEFQDTNVINWVLFQNLIGEETQVIVMGDSLQRIYGFIGALPNIMEEARIKYKMDKIVLKTNHRFKENHFLLTLDKIIRENAKNPWNPSIHKSLTLKILTFDDQWEEAQGILMLSKKILELYPHSRIAILVRSRNENTNLLLEAFNEVNQPYFYALYTDEDTDYIKFHKTALLSFKKALSIFKGKFNKRVIEFLLNDVKENFSSNTSSNFAKVYSSLYELLKVFLEFINKEYKSLEMEDRIELIKETLESNALKQYLKNVKTNIVIATMHSAKGLEWDYVIIPDVEKNSIPNYKSLCRDCSFSHKCKISWGSIRENDDFIKKFFDELNLFYVAATRARKRVFFSFSRTRMNFNKKEEPSNLSCMLKLPGLKPRLIPGEAFINDMRTDNT